VDDRLAQLAKAREQALMRGGLETVNAQASALLSQFRRYQALAQVQVAESRLRSVIGIEFDDMRVDTMTLPEIIQQVAQTPGVTAVQLTRGDNAQR
jgi:hypothetical protein